MFLECSNLISPNPAAEILAAAVGDLSGGGRFSLLLAPRGAAPRVLAWDGAALVDATPPALRAGGPGVQALAVADMDGDGREEIYMLCAGDHPATAAGGMPDRLYADFGGLWADVLALPANQGAANRRGGRALAALDRLGIGRYGVAVAGRHGPMRLYELDRRGHLRDRADDAGLDLQSPAGLLLTAALGGPRPDLLVAGPDVAGARLFRLGGDPDAPAGHYGEWGPPRPAGADGRRGRAPLRAAQVIDHDGAPHVVLLDADGPARWLGPRADGGIADIPPPDLAAGEEETDGGRVRGVLAADFDNDGYEEVLVLVDGGPNRLYAWREDHWRRVAAGDAERPWAADGVALAADLDGDGQLEVLLAGSGLPLTLLLAAPNDHGWLRVIPETAAGAPARGARVRLMAGGRVQTRCVDAGGSPGAHLEPVAHFGLGPLRHIDRVEITWPSGLVRRFDGVRPCQVLRIREG